MAKVLILGMDGLEYNLVLKWDLKNLMQRTYGSIKIPREYYSRDVPYTPIIWVSFITGKHPEEHQISSWFTYKNRFLDWIRHKPPLTWIKGKRKILSKIGLKPKVIDKSDWKTNLTTIFDLCKPSIPLYIPAYNSLTWYREELEKALSKGINQYIKTIWRLHEMKEKELFENLGKNWKLLMIWFDIADLLGHVCWTKHRIQLIKAYKRLDNLVKEVSSKLKDTIILVISDHGMQLSEDGVTGNHSDHNFWSINIKTNWKPRDITDFYPKILEWCKATDLNFKSET